MPIWLAYGLLIILSCAAVWGYARLLHPPQQMRRLTWAGRVLRLAWIAFALRLAVGVALALALPWAGYADNPVSGAGYIFADAYQRDMQAWELAQSDRPLGDAFSSQFSSDQYGGMLALSALVYRLLSPEMHSPLLLVVLGAAAAALGVLALGMAGAAWFGETAGLLAAGIMALYPEAVLLGASQMREAFVIPALAVVLYGVIALRQEGADLTHGAVRAWRSKMLGVTLLAALVLLLIQPPAALAAFIILLGLFVLAGRKVSWRAFLLAALGILSALVIVISVWANLPSLQQAGGPLQVLFTWLQNNLNLQATWTVQASGWLQEILRSAGGQWKLLLVVAYGMVRPLLPAALGDDGLWVWRLIETLRAAGWYALLPLLIYAPVGMFRTALPAQKSGLSRAQLAWLAASAWAWVLLASANGGGDQWDNPRYRTMFLALLALLAAWTWVNCRGQAWLRRLLLVEGVFIVVFTAWYLVRNYTSFGSFNLWAAGGLFALCTGIVLGMDVWRWR